MKAGFKVWYFNAFPVYCMTLFNSTLS